MFFIFCLTLQTVRNDNYLLMTHVTHNYQLGDIKNDSMDETIIKNESMDDNTDLLSVNHINTMVNQNDNFTINPGNPENGDESFGMELPTINPIVIQPIDIYINDHVADNANELPVNIYQPLFILPPLLSPIPTNSSINFPVEVTPIPTLTIPNPKLVINNLDRYVIFNPLNVTKSQIQAIFTPVNQFFPNFYEIIWSRQKKVFSTEKNEEILKVYEYSDKFDVCTFDNFVKFSIKKQREFLAFFNQIFLIEDIVRAITRITHKTFLDTHQAITLKTEISNLCSKLIKSNNGVFTEDVLVSLGYVMDCSTQKPQLLLLIYSILYIMKYRLDRMNYWYNGGILRNKLSKENVKEMKGAINDPANTNEMNIEGQEFITENDVKNLFNIKPDDVFCIVNGPVFRYECCIQQFLATNFHKNYPFVGFYLQVVKLNVFKTLYELKGEKLSFPNDDYEQSTSNYGVENTAVKGPVIPIITYDIDTEYNDLILKTCFLIAMTKTSTWIKEEKDILYSISRQQSRKEAILMLKDFIPVLERRVSKFRRMTYYKLVRSEYFRRRRSYSNNWIDDLMKNNSIFYSGEIKIVIRDFFFLSQIIR